MSHGRMYMIQVIELSMSFMLNSYTSQLNMLERRL